MNFRRYALVAFVISCLLSGCVSNPINARTAENYYKSGMEAEGNGNLILARKNYSRAYTNAQMGNLGPTTEAYALYEWSRVTGYLGMYADAEKGFNETLRLIDLSKGKADNLKPPALGELARLLHDTSRHEKAVPVYEKAVAELDNRNIVKVDPIGFTIVLDDYCQSLRAVGDVSRADEVAARSLSIKEANKGKKAGFIGMRYRNS